jgi:hypothetical protein
MESVPVLIKMHVLIRESSTAALLIVLKLLIMLEVWQSSQSGKCPITIIRTVPLKIQKQKLIQEYIHSLYSIEPGGNMILKL